MCIIISLDPLLIGGRSVDVSAVFELRELHDPQTLEATRCSHLLLKHWRLVYNINSSDV